MRTSVRLKVFTTLVSAPAPGLPLELEICGGTAIGFPEQISDQLLDQDTRAELERIRADSLRYDGLAFVIALPRRTAFEAEASVVVEQMAARATELCQLPLPLPEVPSADADAFRDAPVQRKQAEETRDAALAGARRRLRWGRPVRWLHRHRRIVRGWVVVVAAIAVAAAVVGGVVTCALTKDPPRQAVAPPTPRTEERVPPRTIHLGDLIEYMQLAWSPHGNYLALWTSLRGGPVMVVDVDTGSRIPLDGYFDLAAWSPSGTLALGSGDQATEQASITLFDAPGHTTSKLEIRGGTIAAIAWSPTGDRLAACTSSSCLAWTVATGEATDLSRGAAELAFAPDGHALALNRIAGISLVDLAPRGERRDLASSAGYMRMAWSPDGRSIAALPYPKLETDVMETLHTPGIPKVWDVASGTGRTLVGHSGMLFDLAFSARALATAGVDGLRIWNVTTGASTRWGSSAQDEVEVDAVAWSSDGRLASCGAWLTVWDVRGTPTQLGLCRGKAIAWSPDARTLAVLTYNGLVLWNVPPPSRTPP